ncbi:MAG: MBL fold metallo-hydrolase [Proteobacteria bacterium]|nr:MBL fold metallo-hydrolase [Pseudomonadota bacterium]MCP4917638.1 MBL fold metallo-hydrolase [Pseudomonadota bacterium]
MKQTHRSDVFTWSSFDEARNVDFNGYAWIRPAGNVLIDPMPMSAHDRAHLDALGRTTWIVVTNSDHTRAAAELARELGAKVAGPAAERGAFEADAWLEEGDEVVPGLKVYTLDGSKTPGELALWLDGTLFFGDLVRGHAAGKLNLLPPAKLTDERRARTSVRRLITDEVEAVLVGDGWPCFQNGAARLRDLVG